MRADTPGVALLLAGPAVGELWPDDGGISLTPPRRAGAGFVAHVTVAGRAHGVLTLNAGVLPSGAPGAATDARLVLSVDGADVARVAHAAGAFLDALASAAARRSSAA